MKKVITIILLSCLTMTCLATEIRIVSLAPSQTELLVHMGFGEEIVGISDHCNYPPDKIRRKVRVGGMELNIEKIVSLQPTMILDINSLHRKYETLFSRLGLNYINFRVSDTSQLPQMALEVATLLGEPEKGKSFSEEWNSKTSILRLTKTQQPVKVYCEIWDNPIQAAGINGYIGKMIEKAGGINVIENKTDYPVINTETIMLKSPDVIIVCYPVKNIDSIKERPGWSKIKAITNQQIYHVDQDLFVRPGPRNIEGLLLLKKIFSKATK